LITFIFFFGIFGRLPEFDRFADFDNTTGNKPYFGFYCEKSPYTFGTSIQRVSALIRSVRSPAVGFYQRQSDKPPTLNFENQELTESLSN